MGSVSNNRNYKRRGLWLAILSYAPRLPVAVRRYSGMPQIASLRCPFAAYALFLRIANFILFPRHSSPSIVLREVGAPNHNLRRLSLSMSRSLSSPLHLQHSRITSRLAEAWADFSALAQLLGAALVVSRSKLMEVLLYNVKGCYFLS